MEQNDQRNFLIAMVLTVAFLFIYQVLVLDPAAKKSREAAAARQAAAAASEGLSEGATSAPVSPVSAQEAVARETGRIRIDSGGVDGSIRLSGARLDDLSLKRHFLTVEDKDEVRLLAPESAEHGYFAFIGWTDGAGQLIAGANADWRLVSGEVLSATSPVTLTFEKDGLRLTRRISVDDDYMFTFADTVENAGSAPVVVRPVAAIRRFGDWKAFVKAIDPASTDQSGVVHQGLVGVLDKKLELLKYNAMQKGKTRGGTATKGGWWGLTDKYWMAAIVPDQARAFEARTSARVRDGRRLLEITTSGEEMSLAPGETVTVENRIFAGAKEVSLLKRYETSVPVPRFNDAVDWGMFYFLTKPFFWLLQFFEKLVAGIGPVSFGVAILMLTVAVKAVFFPIQNKAYESMTKMKKLTEPMKEIRERFAADKQRQQQEILKLYQKEKVNPLSGCLPILLQIPVFFALYKTLVTTIEMRHAPFFGWVKDLSAPDPTAIGNLFGLLGGVFTAEQAKAVPILGIVLGIGVLPILYGFTMWGVQSLSPPPPDEMQRKIFAFLPLVFTFMFAGFAAGLVIYWVWSNVLTYLQQYVIMRRQGVETGLDKFLARRFGKAGGASKG